MNAPKDLKRFPIFETDEDAERFVAEADLSEYDFSGFQPAKFAFDEPGKLIIQVPQSLLDAVKSRAKARGIPYRRYIRDLLERDTAQGTADVSRPAT